MVFKKEHSLFLNTLFCIGLFNACTQTQVYAIPVNLVPSTGEGIKYPIHIACECDYSLYVDGKYIDQANKEVNIIESVEYGHPGWNATKKFYPIIYDKSPKIIAFTGVGSQFPGFLNGFIMDMNNGEDYTKYQEWKCTDFSSKVTKVPPSNWITYDYDDSDWSMSSSYGKNYQNNSFQLFEKEREGINLEAEWLWTSNNAVSNIYCRKKNENVKPIPVVLTTVPVQTSAPTHMSTTIHPTVAQTSAPHPVQTHAPTHVSKTIHTTVAQTSAPTTVSKTIHTTVAQTSAPHPVQTSAPHPVQTSAPHPVQTSAPHPVQTSAPHPVQTSAPHPVQTSAPHPVQTSAPHPVQTSAPHPVQTSAPTTVSKTIHTTVAQTSAPTRVSKTIHPTIVQTSAPHPVQTSAPTRVSKTIHPTIVQTSAPTHVLVPVSKTAHPTNYNVVYSPHIKIIIQNVIYSRNRSYNHIDNLLRRLKIYHDDDNIYQQILHTRHHIQHHYNTILHVLRILIDSLHNHEGDYNDDKHDNRFTKPTPQFIQSMHKLDTYIQKIEESLQFIKGNHKYILLHILNKLKLQYRQDTEKLFTIIKYT
jgi:hypothetical protein